MTEKGFIQIDRQIVNWRWYKNINTFKVFIHLLFCANYAKAEYMDQTIERGQLVTGINLLSCETGLTIQEIRTALKNLKLTNDITIKTTSKFSIITIVDYEKFQPLTSNSTSNQHLSNKRATNNQPQYNKNNKKNKNNNNYERNASYTLEAFERKSLFTD